MSYFKLNGHDYSMYVNALSIDTKHKYTARENASGNLMVKYITKKRNVNVGIIPLDETVLAQLVNDLDSGDFTKQITFLDPKTNTMQTINCIIPVHTIDYHMIRADRILTKAFTFTCEEL